MADDSARIDNAKSPALSMRVHRQSRQPSSEASLWDDLDDTEQALANLATPLLAVQPASAAVPRTPSPLSVDPPAKPLEHQLFPSIEAEQSRAPFTPVSSYINGADMGNPWSPVGVNSTQFMRQEWLQSAARNDSGSLIDENTVRPEAVTATTSKFFPRTKAVRTPTQQASSLLDKLDEICGSSPSVSRISPVRSSDSVQERVSMASAPEAQTMLSATGSSQASLPLDADLIDDDPDWEIDTDTDAAIQMAEQVPKRMTQTEQEELTAIDILNMSCSPPSQLMPHITLIKDMPEEQQQLYHRLAFNTSSTRSSQNSTRGVTARGTKGKTWKTTWQDDESGNTVGPGAFTSGRRVSSATRKPRSSAFAKWPFRKKGKSKGNRT